MVRPDLAGPDSGPESPFPVSLSGRVIAGFGRGGKKLNCPTANLDVPQDCLGGFEFGVYFGWASLYLPSDHPDRRTPLRSRSRAELPAGSSPLPDPSFPDFSADPSGLWAIYPMVMSLGKNPFFDNAERSLEVHILHLFVQDFYGCDLRIVILGYIRPEKGYDSLDALVDDIRIDCEVARKSLDRDAYSLRELTRATGRGTVDGSWLVRPPQESEASATEVILGKKKKTSSGERLEAERSTEVPS